MNTIKQTAKYQRGNHLIADQGIRNAKQLLGNATINLPEYRTASFRASQVRESIDLLLHVERTLLVQEIIEAETTKSAVTEQ